MFLYKHGYVNMLDTCELWFTICYLVNGGYVPSPKLYIVFSDNKNVIISFIVLFWSRIALLSLSLIKFEP